MAKSKNGKSKSNQPAFEDGSYFKDVPMFDIAATGVKTVAPVTIMDEIAPAKKPALFEDVPMVVLDESGAWNIKN